MVAPPRSIDSTIQPHVTPSVTVVASVWGTISAGGSGQAHVWILDDRSMVVVSNGPGDVRRVTLHPDPTTPYRISHRGLDVTLDDGTPFQIIAAPCTCGAGRAGTASPVDGHTVNHIGTTQAVQDGWVVV